MIATFYDRVMEWPDYDFLMEQSKPKDKNDEIIRDKIVRDKIVRKTDTELKDKFEQLSLFCPEKNRNNEDYWVCTFLRVVRGEAIDKIINEWSVSNEEREKVHQLFNWAPKYLATTLEHYCEQAAKQVYNKILVLQSEQKSRENNKEVSARLFKQVLDITDHSYQKPSEKEFLFKNIESLHQIRIFAKFDLERKKTLKNWAITSLRERVGDKYINIFKQKNENPWLRLYQFCEKLAKTATDKREKKVKDIFQIHCDYYTYLILSFNKCYTPTNIRKNKNGREILQPRYEEPNEEQLQKIANEFNQYLSQKSQNFNSQRIKKELLELYRIISSAPPPDSFIIDIDEPFEQDEGDKLTLQIPNLYTPLSSEAKEVEPVLNDSIKKLDNSPQYPYQVILLLNYGFEDKLFITDHKYKLDNVKLSEKEIGLILGKSQTVVSRTKNTALTKIITPISKTFVNQLPDLTLISTIKDLLEKELLPNYYFHFIRSWIFEDISKTSWKERKKGSQFIGQLTTKVRQNITQEIVKAEISPHPENVVLLDPPIYRLVETYVKTVPFNENSI